MVIDGSILRTLNLNLVRRPATYFLFLGVGKE
jgi:hypothetical protein